MRNLADIAKSIAAGTAMGVVGGTALGILVAPIINKLLDKMEEEAYQKVWNAGADLVEAVIEVIEEEMDNV